MAEQSYYRLQVAIDYPGDFMNIAEAVATRRSVREFLDTPVPYATIERVLDQARFAPSGCNYQPWEATVLTGAPLKALQDVLLAAQPDDPQEYDWAAPGKHPQYQARLQAVGAAMYGAMQVARADKEARSDFTKANLVSFGAPVLLLCHFPKFMKEPQWSDVGMWLQTIMLLLRGEGLDTCPQEYMATMAAPSRRTWACRTTPCCSAAWLSAGATTKPRSTISSANACRWISM